MSTPRPYYENEQVVIYHGDCREIIPTLPSQSVDLLLTDPPYGISYQSGQRQVQFDFMQNDDDIRVAVEGIKKALRVLRKERHLYIFGPTAMLEGMPVTSPVELIWDKSGMSSGDLKCPWGKAYEYIQFAIVNRSAPSLRDGHGRLAARLRRGSVVHCPRLNGRQIRHPTEKPVALLRELIESSSCIGETVFDPFCGVGSTLVAACLEGRKAIGIEIEERYCEIAQERLEAINRAPRLL